MISLVARFLMTAELVAERRLEDHRLLEPFLKLPRHEFVPREVAHLAYDVEPLELTDGQTISCPGFVAQMTSLLEVEPGIVLGVLESCLVGGEVNFLRVSLAASAFILIAFYSLQATACSGRVYGCMTTIMAAEVVPEDFTGIGVAMGEHVSVVDGR